MVGYAQVCKARPHIIKVDFALNKSKKSIKHELILCAAYLVCQLANIVCYRVRQHNRDY